MKKALPKSLFTYELHADEELFEEANKYIRQYYSGGQRLMQPGD